VNARCKFKCFSKTETTDGFRIEWQPVTCGSEENKKFFKYTPYGKLEVGTINTEVANEIEVGAEYYIDITRA
jgi:hypothetical protein